MVWPFYQGAEVPPRSVVDGHLTAFVALAQAARRVRKGHICGLPVPMGETAGQVTAGTCERLILADAYAGRNEQYPSLRTR